MENKKIKADSNFVKANSEREFDTSITQSQLMTEPNVVASWGACKWGNINNQALIFKVNGALHVGSVLITLGWEDLYAVHLFDKNREQVGESLRGIYADDLVWRIDELVETPQ